MKTDIEISDAARLRPIAEIAQKLRIVGQDVEPYGHCKAKLNVPVPDKQAPTGKLILVTAINPTPAGEGKTTTSVGLADAHNRIERKTVLALREHGFARNRLNRKYCLLFVALASCTLNERPVWRTHARLMIAEVRRLTC